MKVSGVYYNQPFTGEVYRKEANWMDNGHGRGVHLYVELDKPIQVKGNTRESLFLSGWIDGQQYHWGYAVEVK